MPLLLVTTEAAASVLTVSAQPPLLHQFPWSPGIHSQCTLCDGDLGKNTLFYRKSFLISMIFFCDIETEFSVSGLRPRNWAC